MIVSKLYTLLPRKGGIILIKIVSNTYVVCHEVGETDIWHKGKICMINMIKILARVFDQISLNCIGKAQCPSIYFFNV